MGLDGHDRGAKLLCRYLRDAGMEVVYTGIRQTPASIAAVAMQEDVDMVGISILSGAHNYFMPKIIGEMEKNNLHVPIMVGGIIPETDINQLKKLGVVRVYLPGTPMHMIKNDIVEIYEQSIARKNVDGF